MIERARIQRGVRAENGNWQATLRIFGSHVRTHLLLDSPSPLSPIPFSDLSPSFSSLLLFSPLTTFPFTLPVVPPPPLLSICIILCLYSPSPHLLPQPCRHAVSRHNRAHHRRRAVRRVHRPRPCPQAENWRESIAAAATGGAQAASSARAHAARDQIGARRACARLPFPDLAPFCMFMKHITGSSACCRCQARFSLRLTHFAFALC